jgi:hypothetical protein
MIERLPLAGKDERERPSIGWVMTVILLIPCEQGRGPLMEVG